MQNCSRWDLWIIVGRSFWKHTELTLFLMLWAPRKISETHNVFGWTREACSDRSSQLSLFLCHLFIHPRFPHWPFLTTSVYLSLTSVCHEDPAINVATCTSLWTRISETVAVDGSLAWLPSLSLSLFVADHRPVPGPLSSLLHMRNRHRQPLPASLPGTLPDPAMQGASAQHMPVSIVDRLASRKHRHTCTMIYRCRYTGRESSRKTCELEIFMADRRIHFTLLWMN